MESVSTDQGYVTNRDDITRFAVIGDFGVDTKEALGVANLVKSWNPDFITTVGDNNYPNGSAKDIDDNIGQYFHQYIAGYSGKYGPGSDQPRFYPTLGNHDWESIYCNDITCHGPYFDYFGFDPTSHRYYTFQQGPVRFFMLDSSSMEPDGISGLSNQAVWLKEQLARSEATWNLVLLHHPPYSSGGHRSHELLQWPYAEWGADALFAGHNHLYERIERDGMLYFTNGLGGKSRHPYRKNQPEWVKYRVNTVDGAMLVDANEGTITFQFWDRSGKLHDSHSLSRESGSADAGLFSASAQESTSSKISHASSDAVENLQTGEVQLIDYVLNLGQNKAEVSALTGLRFTNVEIPPRAQIIDARIEFVNQRGADSTTSLTVMGEKSCSADPFSPLPNSLSSRAKTSTVDQWDNVADWDLVGESHRSPNLAPIIQEIVNYRGWQLGNAIALYLQGAGKRHAVAFELQPQMAAQLNVVFEPPNATLHEESPAIQGGLQPTLYLPMLVDSRCMFD